MSDLAATRLDQARAVVPPATASGFLRSRAIVSVLMLLVLAALTLLGILARDPLAIMLGALVFVVVLLARLWARLALLDLHYRAEPSRDRLMIGEDFGLSLVVENRKVLPLPWLRLVDYVPNGIEVLGSASHILAIPDTLQLETSLRLAGYERIRLPRRLKAVRRGVYRFGPARLAASDLFGFYEAIGVAPAPSQPVVVYPRIVPIGEFPLPLVRPLGDDRSRRPLITDPTCPAGIREYRVGDRLRDIDWKATAKKGQPYVRTYEASVTGHVVLMLDCTLDEGGSLAARAAVLEDSICAAASLAAYFTGRGYGVGLVSNGFSPEAGGPAVVPPGRGPHQLAEVLKELAGVHGQAACPLEEVVHARGGEALPFGSTIVCLTGQPQAESLACLRSYRAKGCAVTIAYAGRDDPPATGDISLVDLRAVPGLLDPDGEAED